MPDPKVDVTPENQPFEQGRHNTRNKQIKLIDSPF